TRRIAGRKTIKPRSEILINQLSSKPRTEKLKRNAARAMLYRHATFCVAVRSHPLLDLRTACPLALMGNSRSDGRARSVSQPPAPEISVPFSLPGDARHFHNSSRNSTSLGDRYVCHPTQLISQLISKARHVLEI